MISVLTQLSYPSLLLAVLARQLCLPIPAVLFLMTAGALAAHGKLHISLILAAGVLGCVAGDFIWFRIGRHWGKQVLRVGCSLSSDPVGCSRRAREIFDRWGLRLLIVAKLVPGLDGITPPMAGAEGSPVGSFLLMDAIGALLWSGVYTALGYIFADELTVVIRWTERFGTLLFSTVGGALLVLICWRGSILIGTMSRLRLRRMSPSLLAQHLNGSERIVLIDLLGFEDGFGNQEGIAGALRIDPKRLRSSAQIGVAEDVMVVLYCSSKGEMTSARVAIAMKRRGISNVWDWTGV